MSQVTVIAPNVVELVGNLAKQASAPVVERPPPTPPAPKAKPTVKPRDGSDQRSQQLAANENALKDQKRAAGSPSQRGRFYVRRVPSRPSGQPSSLFIAQQIAQQNSGASAKRKRFDKAIAAYNRALDNQPNFQPGPVFITRTVDRTV